MARNLQRVIGIVHKIKKKNCLPLLGFRPERCSHIDVIENVIKYKTKNTKLLHQMIGFPSKYIR